MEMHIHLITPPLPIISKRNGCEGYSSNTYTHAKFELTGSMGTSTNYDFFVAFNAKYQNITTYGKWFKWQHETLTQQFCPVVMNHLNNTLSILIQINPELLAIV